MSKSKRCVVAPDEQAVLDGFHLQLIESEADIARCNALVTQHHYLHSAAVVGEHVRYVAVYKGQWLAVAVWSAAAFHLKARDSFIGWSHEQCRRRRALIANNARLLVLPECHYPNLISRFMKFMLARLSDDWLGRWGHPIALVETFVDPHRFQGTCYKVSGWSHLGRTQGWKRDADDFYEKHESPKQIWVRELHPKACAKLRAAELPPEWAGVEAQVAPRCVHKAAEICSLMDRLRTRLPEFRRAQSLAYPLPGMIALILTALVTGVRRGPDDLESYAASLSQAQLRALRFRHEPGSYTIRHPKRTTFARILAQVDARILEQLLLEWQAQVLGPADNRFVIVDGKKLRHGGGEIVNAVDGNGRFLGAEVTQAKSNEIPAARLVLGRLDLNGKVVLADALHTQVQTAQQILHQQGGDYLFTVKANQPTLFKTLENLFEQQDFSPSAQISPAGADPGAQLRPRGDSVSGPAGSHADAGGICRRPDGGPLADPGEA